MEWGTDILFDSTLPQNYCAGGHWTPTMLSEYKGRMICYGCFLKETHGR